MSEKRFQLRLISRYERPDNSVADLREDILEDGADAWHPFEPSLFSPGFQLFLSAALSCQHMYFRLNCAERGLLLESAEGGLAVVANQDWEIQRLRVHFAGKLVAGTPTQGAIDYIAERMGHCPVSANLKPVLDRETRVELR